MLRRDRPFLRRTPRQEMSVRSSDVPAFLGARSAAVLWSLRGADAGRSRDLHWVSTWGTAQQLAAETLPLWVVPPPREPNEPPPPALLPPYPSSFRDETVRMIVRTSIGGEGLRLTLSNALGRSEVHIGAVHVALRERGSAIVAATDRAVTFGGKASFAVQPGTLVVSDPVELAVPPLTELAVSLYLPNETRDVTTHEFALNTTYVVAGNAAARRIARERRGPISRISGWPASRCSLPPTSARSWRSAIRSPTGSPRHPIRIERGRRCSPRSFRAIRATTALGSDQRRDLRQPSAARRHRQERARPFRSRRAGTRRRASGSCCSKASTTSRVWRYPPCPTSERATADELIETLEQIVDRAHARGIKVMGGTLMPMGGLWLHNAETEAMRQAVNEWIRTSGKLDAVADFDAATRDPRAPARLASGARQRRSHPSERRRQRRNGGCHRHDDILSLTFTPPAPSRPARWSAVRRSASPSRSPRRPCSGHELVALLGRDHVVDVVEGAAAALVDQVRAARTGRRRGCAAPAARSARTACRRRREAPRA